MVELLPYCVLRILFRVVLVECDDINDSLWILLLLFLCDTAVVQQSLPFFWEALDNELA